MIDKIIDIDLEDIQYEFSAEPPVVIFESGKKLKLDYVDVFKRHLKSVRANNKEKFNELLNILNNIYTEHIKLITLGCEYPLYTISALYGLECLLDRFSGIGKITDVYAVKPFVTEIRFDDAYVHPIKELKITNRVEIMRLPAGQKVKITGIENAVFTTSIAMNVIDYTLNKEKSNVLTLKYLDRALPSNNKIYSVEELKLEDTCKIENITSKMIKQFPNLKRITLCKSIKNIDYIDIAYVVRRKYNENGILKEYINIDNLRGMKPDNFETDNIIWLNTTS